MRPCDFKICAISVLSFIGSACGDHRSGSCCVRFIGISFLADRTLLLSILVLLTPGFLPCSRKQNCLSLSTDSSEVCTTTASRTWKSREQLVDNAFKARGVGQGCPSSGFLLAMAFDRSSPQFELSLTLLGSIRYEGPGFPAACPMCLC